MSPLQAQRSTNNISSILSKNILGVLLGFCDLETLPQLTKLNRKFKSVISDEKILPIFSEYIKERENSRKIEDASDVFHDKKSKTSYITGLRNRLANKYNSTQVGDFLTELTKSLLFKFTQKGKLNLACSSLGGDPQNLKNISEALKGNKTITELYLNSNYLGGDPQNLKNLSESLKVNDKITRLYLGSNSLGGDPQNLKNLSEALKVNKTITKLDLGGNSLGGDPQNLKNLSEALKVNKTITELGLDWNSLGEDPQNLKNISEALKVNKTITELGLDSNSLGEDPHNLKNLSEALKVNKTITKLYLRSNSLEYKYFKKLLEIRSNLDLPI
jgi:hypothetical protein